MQIKINSNDSGTEYYIADDKDAGGIIEVDDVIAADWKRVFIEYQRVQKEIEKAVEGKDFRILYK